MNIKKLIPKNIKNVYINIIYKNFTNKNKLNILNDEETIKKIIRDKKSIVRFGDGEFKWILGVKQESFQNYSKELADRLAQILQSTSDDKMLICIPEGLNKVDEYTEDSQLFWRNFIRWHGKEVVKYLNKRYIYGNTNFTRWYIEYNDKSKTKDKIENLKKIWEKKEIVIIEGKDTKLGVGNDLFKNCKMIERILAPSKNAFNKYQKILEEAKKIDKDKLIIIALGPTATILAYDLTQLGYQAIDIGHIDIEYEWYLKQATKKIAIPGKYVNEAGGMDNTRQLDNDKNYQNSIIGKIGDESL